MVGTGTVNSGSFSKILWDYAPLYIKTEVSVAGASYLNLGYQQLNYVPAAYYSRVSSKTFDLKIRGNNNITVGTQIPPQSNVSNTVAIGSGVVVSESNTIRLGNDSTQFIETTGAISTTNRILVNTGDVSANVTPYGQIRAYRNDYHAAALVANSGIVTSTGGMYTSGSVQAGNGVANIAVLNGTSGIVSSTGGMYTSGTVTATKFVGDGSLLTNVSGGGGTSGISDIVDDTTPQLGGNLDANGKNISFGDSATPGTDDTLSFGADNDLQIYHNGTHSYIDDAGTGKLILRGNTDVEIHKYTGEYMICLLYTSDAADE